MVVIQKVKRGPKPKPHVPCLACGNINYVDRCRGYCRTCYTRVLRSGSLQRLPRKTLPDRLTAIQDELLVGSLLGDGCLYRRKVTHHPYFSIQRCIRDKDYLLWEAEILNPFVVRISKGEYDDARTGNTYKHIKLCTHRTAVFETYYNSWYPNGKKVVPNNLNLTPLSLAIWFADDGNVRTQNSPWRFLLKLSTHGFLLQDTERLCAMLSLRYGEYFGITREGSAGIIYTFDNGSRAFLHEIDSHFPESMSRKAIWRQDGKRFYENEPKKAHPNMCNRRAV